MRRTAVASLAALCALALGCGTALADRRATREEHRDISALSSHPSRCTAVRISTVDSSWGIYFSRGLRSCPGADGYVVVREIDGFWEHVRDGGGTDQGPCDAVRPVPARVGADLRICKLPQNCGTLRIDGTQLPVTVTHGRVRCLIARRAARAFLPERGLGRQTFRLGGRRWFCASSHGRELENGGVGHCLSAGVKVMIREPEN